MHLLPGYEAEDRFYASERTSVYRARRVADHVPVVLKVPRDTTSSVDQIARYRNELQFLRGLDLPGVIKAYGLERHGDRVVLVLEDFGADSLRRFAGADRLSLAELLPLAIQIASAMGDLHATGIVHKDIKPDNIAYSTESRTAKLIDFGIASREQERVTAGKGILEGTLSYIAPEQTGRTNRPIDRRTDLYSFGCTLWELLLGRPVYSSADPLEMIHFHLAVRPVPPHLADPSIPEVLSDVVMKLLSKAPEDRYQTGRGLELDLAECLRQLRETGRIEPFALGTRDEPERFEIPRQLYGRETSVTALRQVLGRVADGGAEAVLVTGYSGVGKSSVVRTLAPAVTALGGFFVSGKFDQLQRSVPYSAVVVALRELIEQLLTEDDGGLARWRQTLLAAVGVNGRVVAELLPELELLLGPLPAVPELGSAESQHRFNLTFQNFIGAFCARQHPLVIFLDDMQWADSASLHLLTRLLTGEETESLLVVEAYRDNEVSPAHPFVRALAEQRELGVRIETLTLAPLDADDVGNLVADCLRQAPSAVRPLSDIVWSKTGGNPFFLDQFLRALHAAGRIAFDRKLGRFTFDLDGIDGLGITDNVVDLLVQKLESLPSDTRHVLQLASAIGNRFDIETLSVVSERPVDAVDAALRPALEEGLIRRSASPHAGERGRQTTTHTFLHDRVQQAAYSTVPEEKRELWHLAIGRLLVATGNPDSHLFEIVGHLNRGSAWISLPAERLQLAHLNLRAAARAASSNAYEVAATNLRAGIALLGEDAWDVHPDLCFRAHAELAENLYLATDFPGAFAVLDHTAGRTLTPLDQIRLLTLRALIHSSIAENPAAVRCALEAAALGGIAIPTDPTEMAAQIGAMVGQIFARLAELGTDGLLGLPAMTNPEAIALTSVFGRCGPALYQSDPTLMMLVSCHMVLLSIEHGNCPASALGYGVFGSGLSAGLADHENAYRFTKLAVDLNRRFGDRSLESHVLFLFATFASPWIEPAEIALAHHLDGVKSALDGGDIAHAVWHATFRAELALIVGRPVARIAADAADAIALAQRLRNVDGNRWLRLHTQFIQSMRGELPGTTLDGPGFDEAEVRAELEEAGNRSVRCLFELFRLRQRSLLGSPEEALAAARATEALSAAQEGFPVLLDINFFGSLARTRVRVRTADDVAQLDRNQLRLKGWADRCPENARHRHIIIEAERARLRGDIYQAMALYDEGIAYASERDSLHIEAIGRELAGRMWAQEGRTDLAWSYLRRARASYVQWGATGKVEQLDVEFPELVPRPTLLQVRGTLDGTVDRNDAFDLHTVVKASQAISGEIVLERLLATLMRIILENAGADTGSLVLAAQRELRVQAVASAGQDVVVMQSTALSEATRLSERIVNYVVRTRQTEVVDDPADQSRWRTDPYIQTRRPKSILCAPIVYKSDLMGVLYLENNLLAGAFTRTRLEALGILLAQVAVSIDNATLFEKQSRQAAELARYQDHLEVLVRERTAELKAAQGRLVAMSRRAGMAEIATGVLHNVGNALTSVNVSAGLISQRSQAMRLPSLRMAVEMLEQHSDDLGSFVRVDPRGAQVLPYLSKLVELLESDQVTLKDESEVLQERIAHINSIVEQQQEYAQAHALLEDCSIRDVIEEAVSLAALDSHGIPVDFRIADLPEISIDRHQVLQILNNLLTNARQAIDAAARRPGRITIGARPTGDGRFQIDVSDDGIGVAEEHRGQVFTHGFTTKRDGHGFGLHNACNAAIAMGGTLTFASGGPGLGATFTLVLPMRPRGPGTEMA